MLKAFEAWLQKPKETSSSHSTKVLAERHEKSSSAESQTKTTTKGAVINLFLISREKISFLLMSSNFSCCNFSSSSSLSSRQIFKPFMETFQSRLWAECDMISAPNGNHVRLSQNEQSKWIENIRRNLIDLANDSRMGDSPLLSYAACMHKLVVLLVELYICRSAVLVRSLVSTQLHLDRERLKSRLQDWS